ncbi:MAG: hypothetical protein DSY55_06575 [Clostridia bacterium]|nr:MAG: hypothetical protein DSY55_06575 [Clostridia bacterium]
MKLPPPFSDAFRAATWRMVARVLLKATLIFLLLNLLFAWIFPMEALGRVSLYNHLWAGRLRLPYGEDPAKDYNLSLYNIPAMFHSHVLMQPKADDEFRVLVIGDSATWGWFLQNKDTLSGRLNAGAYRTEDGKRLVFYNLGYPVMSLTKDIVLLDEAMHYQPDMVLWPVTLASFASSRQLAHPLLTHNLGRAHQHNMPPDDERLPKPTLFARSIIGQRRELADLMRLQTLGLAWTATGIDQHIPATIPLRKTDLADDRSWETLAKPATLDDELLAMDVLAAGVARAGDIPVLIVNEPMFISDGANSDIRYNSFYPRWAYDQYRALLAQEAQANGWDYLDLWDSIPPEEFTDTPVHLTPAGEQMLADILGPEVTRRAGRE